MGIPKQSKRLREARDAAYREVIIETAERLFGASGYAATKMADIASAAGISLATLYGLFPGKRDLHEAITSVRGGELVERTLGEVTRLAAGRAHPLGVMLRGMSVYMRFFMSHPDYLRMILFDGYVWYHRAASPSREQSALWERGREFLMAGFQWGIDARVFVEEDPIKLARTLTVLQQTRLANWVMSGMEESPDSVISRASAELVRIFCQPWMSTRLLSPDGSVLSAELVADDQALWRVTRQGRSEES